MNGTKGGRFKLLVADDEQWIHEKLRSMIDGAGLGIEVLRPAEDGEEALRIIKSDRPDILISDINMPFMSGNELIRKAKEYDPRLQVIVLSGYDDFAFVREALVCGALDYLIKPISRHGLLDVLDLAISKIGETNREQEEQTLIRRKLLEATSLLRDGEFSMVLNGIESAAAAPGMLTQLNLRFSMFTLVLIKIQDLPRIAQCRGVPVSRLSMEVKNALSRGKHTNAMLLFNNIYARSEFLLIVEPASLDIEALGRDLRPFLEKRFGTRVRIAYSRPYLSLDKMKDAYAEARLALSVRPLNEADAVAGAERTATTEIHRRISPEQEKQLLFALQSGNKEMVREVIFDRIGLRNAEKSWLLIEIRQCVEYVANVVFHYVETEPGAILAVETYDYLLGTALDREDVTEVRAVIDQILDEIFVDGTGHGAGESMKGTVDSVRHYIEENYFSDISLSSLSERFNVDRSYLCRSFKKMTGTNLMLAIAQKRIGKAREYIRESLSSSEKTVSGDLSLAEISDLVGYEEYTYFSRVFRKLTGESPSDYRDRIAGEERS